MPDMFKMARQLVLSAHPSALPALEATQEQLHGVFSQLPYKCHQNRVASVGDLLKICPWVASRVALCCATIPTHPTQWHVSRITSVVSLPEPEPSAHTNLVVTVQPGL